MISLQQIFEAWWQMNTSVNWGIIDPGNDWHLFVVKPK